MKEEDHKQLVSDYIAYYRNYKGSTHPEGSEESRLQEQTWWLDDLVRDEPETAWPVILDIVSLMDDTTIAALAAGPVEVLLSLHGEAFIDRIEEQARKDPKFRHLLGGVWKLFAKDDIWARVEKARNYKTW